MEIYYKHGSNFRASSGANGDKADILKAFGGTQGSQMGEGLLTILDARGVGLRKSDVMEIESSSARIIE